MRVLVCGGRDFKDSKFIYEKLDENHAKYAFDELCHGAAEGADSIAESWAKHRQINYRGYPAKWKAFGKAAGPIRNSEMLEDFNPEVVIAFPGNEGTANMVQIAQASRNCIVIMYMEAK